MSDVSWTVTLELGGDGFLLTDGFYFLMETGDILRLESTTNNDVTSDVALMDWQIGFTKAFDIVARDNTMTLILNNQTHRYSPEHINRLIGFTRGVLVRVQMTYNLLTTTMFLGWIDEIRPAPGLRGAHTTTVKINGYLSRAQKTESFVALQESKTADQVITAILAGSVLYPPGLAAGSWLLGTVGSSELGISTVLGATSSYLDAETGKTTFNYIGDKWGSGVSVYSALADTVGREYGRLFVSREGIITFWNRHHLILVLTSVGSFSNSMSELSYVYGANLINSATVRANSRKVGVSPETLGIINNSVRIEPSTTKNITFRYTSQTSGEKIAGRNAIAPIQTTDFTVNSSSDGSGTDYTSSVTAAITTETATQSIVTFTSVAVIPVYIQAGAKIRGTVVTDYGTVAQTYQDANSITAYGKHDLMYPYVMDNVVDAQGVAEYIVTSRKNIRGDIGSVQLLPRSNVTLLTHARDRTIGDRITLTETQTGTNIKDYFIIGEHHIVKTTATGKSYSLVWNTEPADTQQYWLLGRPGYGELGVTTYAGPL